MMTTINLSGQFVSLLRILLKSDTPQTVGTDINRNFRYLTNNNHYHSPTYPFTLHLLSLIPSPSFSFKVREGRTAANFPELCVFFITQLFLKIYRQYIHQIKAGYHSYLLVSMILYNSSELELKIVFYFSDTDFKIVAHNFSQPFKTFLLREACLIIMS